MFHDEKKKVNAIIKRYNCFDCKAEIIRGQEKNYRLKDKEGNDGDQIILCDDHYKTRIDHANIN